MYYPYLRGKQFELIALREFATQDTSALKIAPIIEPVKSTFNGLTTAVDIMLKKQMMFAVILNPSDGDFKRINKDILEEMPILSLSKGRWIPAFLYQNNKSYIASAIDSYNLTEVMIVFKDGVEEGAELQGLLSDSRVRYIVNGDADSRSAKRWLGRLGKDIIRLDDNFISQTRNVDYLNIEENKFSEEFSYYQEDNFYGMSDYTTLPKEFVDGGMLPYAVAMHFTYKKTKDAVYVRHFVSDTNDDQSNIQGKFEEAAKKAKAYFEGRVDRTVAIDELINFVNQGKYPGLGTLKKLSIKNHLELMNRILP